LASHLPENKRATGWRFAEVSWNDIRLLHSIDAYWERLRSEHSRLSGCNLYQSLSPAGRC